jgi:hypothetical protein
MTKLLTRNDALELLAKDPSAIAEVIAVLKEVQRIQTQIAPIPITVSVVRKIVHDSICLTDEYGTERWYNEKGKLHRDGGLPALISKDGDRQEWWVDDKRHREGGLPAICISSICKEWWVDNKRHREGGLPAIDQHGGDQEWWVDDKRHREGDLPAIVRRDGTQEWWMDNKRHRDSGLPAIVYRNGGKEWWVDDKRSRENGLPAVFIYDPPRTIVQWWYNGKRYYPSNKDGVGHLLLTTPTSLTTMVTS